MNVMAASGLINLVLFSKWIGAHGVRSASGSRFGKAGNAAGGLCHPSARE